MGKITLSLLLVLGLASAVPALARDTRPPTDPGSIADEPKDPDDVPAPPAKIRPAFNNVPGPRGVPKDTRRPSDPSSIADEPADPVDEPPVVAPVAPPVVAPVAAPVVAPVTAPVVTPVAAPVVETEPEITLESISIRPTPGSRTDADPEITLDSIRVRATPNWGPELSRWLEVRSHCSGDTRNNPESFEGSQQTIVTRIHEMAAEFRRVDRTTLQTFRDLNSPRKNLGPSTTRTAGLAPELHVVAGHLNDDLGMMTDPVNFRGQGFTTFMARLDFDLKQGRRNADLSEHRTGVSRGANGEVIVGHLDTGENDQLVRVSNQITDPEMARAWTNYNKMVARFRNLELKALQARVNALKHAALCQTAERKVTELLAIAVRQANPSAQAGDSVGAPQAECQGTDRDLQVLLQLQERLGTVLLNLDGVPRQTRVILSTLIDGYRTRHRIRGTLDSLNDKQRDELFAVVREALARLPASR